jgi:hypothetical protein
MSFTCIPDFHLQPHRRLPLDPIRRIPPPKQPRRPLRPLLIPPNTRRNLNLPIPSHRQLSRRFLLHSPFERPGTFAPVFPSLDDLDGGLFRDEVDGSIDET